MQDYERRAIPEVIEEINRKYFLPDIQRNFVWKPEQVYTLFDSIMRDYPISTFLFWKIDGSFLKKAKIKKLEFVKTSKDQNKENTEISSAKEYFLVLDGQQRFTTFYLVLKGNYIIRNNTYDLYFNILSGEEEQEDGILYEFKFFNKNKGENFIEDDESEKKIWYRVKDIYDLNIAQIFSELTRITKTIKEAYSVDLSDNQKNNIARLCQYLKAEKIIYYYPEREPDCDKVLDIFVRTNSGGTQLSYSDILFSTIKSQWSDARDNFSGDSYLILSICYKGSINFKPRMKGNLPEQDHIFSQDELRQAKIPDEKINSIFNIRYIGSSENKSKSNTPFIDWIDDNWDNKDELKKHLIPEGKWNVKSYDDFLKKRKKLMEDCFKY